MTNPDGRTLSLLVISSSSEQTLTPLLRRTGIPFLREVHSAVHALLRLIPAKHWDYGVSQIPKAPLLRNSYGLEL